MLQEIEISRQTRLSPPCNADTGGRLLPPVPAQEWEIRALDDVVADYVTAAVEAAGGNVRKAARQLQISPSTLYARLKSRQAQ